MRLTHMQRLQIDSVLKRAGASLSDATVDEILAIAMETPPLDKSGRRCYQKDPANPSRCRRRSWCHDRQCLAASLKA